MATWNEQLRALRRSRSRSAADLSACTGISQASIRSYELGRRRPTRENLSRLLDCLAADTPTRNVILTDAGFAPHPAVGRYAEPNLSEQAAAKLVGQRSWPAFLLNHRAEVLAVNDVARKFAGLPRFRPDERGNSILTFTTRRAMAQKCENWDALVIGMISAFKAGEPREESLDAPSPSFAPLLEAVCAGDAALVAKFTALWVTTPAWRGGFTGQIYQTIWKADGGGRIRFQCIISCVNTEMGLYLHDWVPGDARSYELLGKLLAG